VISAAIINRQISDPSFPNGSENNVFYLINFESCHVTLAIAGFSFSPTNPSHSKHNPDWNAMKVSLLIKQLNRFLKNGISNAEVRLGYFEEFRRMSLEETLKELRSWVKGKKGENVGDAEISVKPCLPKCWDGNA
jgi:hypothetical protein